MSVRSIEWHDGKVRFLDQSKLPANEVYIETDDETVVARAIKSLALRGAPLIGIAAGYGFVLAFGRLKSDDARSISTCIERATHLFTSTRPTAVNLFWAVNRMRHTAINSTGKSMEAIHANLLAEAIAIHTEDEEKCRIIGQLGAGLLPNAASVLTHCNTGSLATGGDGTAQSILKVAWEQKKLKHVYIDETRPLLQGARLTAWELQRLRIPCTLITDSTAAFLLQQGKVNAIVVGADRITLNGDVANKVGTYGLAVMATYHEIPFYVAAPTSTVDFEMETGREIPIEQRSGTELTKIGEYEIAPAGVDVYSPAFDVTPHELITAIVTEREVLRKPYRDALEALRGQNLSTLSQKGPSAGHAG
ncbi:MAG: S-methyl-5-thioribose-1-phosphate isomerase [Ignavibacteria bacterium]|nr:S-methyl-5-thioribose-1-phosphate isomerase [Ignavibacteria bacterium]